MPTVNRLFDGGVEKDTGTHPIDGPAEECHGQDVRLDLPLQAWVLNLSDTKAGLETMESLLLPTPVEIASQPEQVEETREA